MRGFAFGGKRGLLSEEEGLHLEGSANNEVLNCCLGNIHILNITRKSQYKDVYRRTIEMPQHAVQRFIMHT